MILFDLNQSKSSYHIGNTKREDINAVRYAYQNPNLVFSGGDDGIGTDLQKMEKLKKKVSKFENPKKSNMLGY